jgi:multidrug efflux pump subunit AcrA (membrane-fusion protein)
LLRVAHAFLLVLLLAALVVGTWWFAFRLPVVDVITPSRGDAAEVVYATGVVEPRIWAKVTPLIRERIMELCNCEGAPRQRGARAPDRPRRAQRRLGAGGE